MSLQRVIRPLVPFLSQELLCGRPIGRVMGAIVEVATGAVTVFRPLFPSGMVHQQLFRAKSLSPHFWSALVVPAVIRSRSRRNAPASGCSNTRSDLKQTTAHSCTGKPPAEFARNYVCDRCASRCGTEAFKCRFRLIPSSLSRCWQRFLFKSRSRRYRPRSAEGGNWKSFTAFRTNHPHASRLVENSRLCSMVGINDVAQLHKP